MSFVSTRVSRSAALLCAGLLSMAANADLRPLDDGELAAVSGQGLINIDALTYGGFEFTRVNIGGDIKLLSNIDKLRLGTYARSGGGTVSTQGSDIAIDNFALGRVDNAGNAGATIVPFEIQDPYLEFAFKNNGNGKREVAGIRVGFGRARGDLSGDVLSATGHIDGFIHGPGSVAAAAYNAATAGNCDFQCGLNKFQLSLASNAELTGHVQLIKAGTGEVTQNGEPINRAVQIGIAKDDSFQTTDPLLSGLLPLLSKQNGNCTAVGVQACFDLQNYKSFFVGDPTDSNLLTGGARGAFISLQGQTVPWQDLGNSGKIVNAQSGAFLNFAQYKNAQNKDVYPIVLSLLNALQGTPRVDTCVGGKGC
jgi:hypothetical protein